MAAGFVFDALRMHLKARGMTYADLAKALRVSEATVKRIFAIKNCTLDRLEAICEVIQVDLAQLARAIPRDDRLINQLSRKQEEGLIAKPALFLVAVCAMQQMRIEEIVATYRLDKTQCVALLLQLEKIGLLEVHENNRIRLLLSRSFAWIPDGPIMRYVKSQMGDYFSYPFGERGEFMRMVAVQISREAQAALLSRLEQIAREYSEQHNADSHLAPLERQALTVLIAVRSWEPAVFKGLRRRA
jgi:DNA-binding Xre family transcriptional regulator